MSDFQRRVENGDPDGERAGAAGYRSADHLQNVSWVKVGGKDRATIPDQPGQVQRQAAHPHVIDPHCGEVPEVGQGQRRQRVGGGWVAVEVRHRAQVWQPTAWQRRDRRRRQQAATGRRRDEAEWIVSDAASMMLAQTGNYPDAETGLPSHDRVRTPRPSALSRLAAK
jgi:hypothetical protein